ncbi:MAG: hypothetical protein ACJ768_24280 [Gaiellaceae bacterium]
MSATAAAFGFNIAGTPGEPWLAVRDCAGWPLLTFERDPEQREDEGVRVDAGSFRAAVPRSWPDERMLHPGLALAALDLAGPRGVDSLHAGAVLGPEGAWALVGTKEAGKSTLVGHFAALGADVLTDDVLVIEGDRCLAGPRFVDLRPSAAERMRGTIAARGGTRGRLLLPPAPASAPLAGFVYLAWGDEIALHPLPAPERLKRLVARRAEDLWPRDASLLLDLAKLPAFELRRPKRWDLLDATAEALSDLVTVPRARVA